MLNPWEIEYDYKTKREIQLTIMNQDTGERKFVYLSCDDIDNIIEVTPDMISLLAKICAQGKTDEIVGFIGKTLKEKT